MAPTNTSTKTLEDFVMAITASAERTGWHSDDDSLPQLAHQLVIENRDEAITAIAERFMRGRSVVVLWHLERVRTLLEPLVGAPEWQRPLFGFGREHTDAVIMEWLRHGVLSYVNEDYAHPEEGATYFEGWLIGVAALRIAEVYRQRPSS